MKRTNTAVWLEKYTRWQINVQKDGKRRSFTSSEPGKKGQREANAKADAWLDNNIENNNVRTEQLLESYVAKVTKTTSKSNSSKEKYHCENWIKPAIGSMRINKINEGDLQDILDNAFAKGLSKKTITGIKATIKSFIKFCRIKKLTMLFPESLSVPTGAKTSSKNILQPEDMIKLFSCDKVIYRGKEQIEKYINAYRFQVLTGLRPGELVSLEWGDINGDTVYIKRAQNYHGEITTGKNQNAIRHFVLMPLAMAVLEAQKEITSSGKVFNINAQSTYEHHWAKYCEYNGISKVTPYELRHTFVSLAKNLPDGKIKPLVGHSRNMDTFGTYGHEVNGELQDTANQLNDIFAAVFKKCI